MLLTYICMTYVNFLICFLNFGMIIDLLNLFVPIQSFEVFCVQSYSGPALRFSVLSVTVQCQKSVNSLIYNYFLVPTIWLTRNVAICCSVCIGNDANSLDTMIASRFSRSICAAKLSITPIKLSTALR